MAVRKLALIALLLQPTCTQLSVEDQVSRANGDIEIKYCMS